MKRVAVIGAGIIGSTLARALAEGGAEVTVYDAGQEAASDGSLAWLNAMSTLDPGYGRLRAASMRLWHRIAAEPGCPVALRGALMWGAGDAARSVRVMAEAGWDSRLVDAAAIAEIAPRLRPPEAALWSAGEGYADPARITGWMRARAEAAGARIQQAEVTDAEALDADAVVVAAGNGSAALLPGLPLRRSPGIVMRSAPLPPVAPCVMASPKLDFWQGDDGVIVMSSSLSKTPQRADDMVAADAADVLEELFGLRPEITGAIRRDRPIPADGFPLLGRWQGRVWVAAMHSGMTLAPVVAEALADAILGRAQRHDLDAFDPRRDMGAKMEQAVSG